jgi:hypothetical protein
MVDVSLLPAIRAAIRANELGPASPYKLSYARLGQSGASFGIFQGDTHVNGTARSTLQAILNGAGADGPAVARIMAAVSVACPQGNPLNPADTTLANAALSSTAGQAAVDAMDNQLMQVVLKGLDNCITGAGDLPIDGEALLYMALWINMTGAPTTLVKWLGGLTVSGVPAPVGPSVCVADIQAYLKATAYFTNHPQNFAHMQASVAVGVPLLPYG